MLSLDATEPTRSVWQSLTTPTRSVCLPLSLHGTYSDEEIGETNWDSAAVYGDSEVLIGKWFKRTGKRDEIFLATKFTVSPRYLHPARTLSNLPSIQMTSPSAPPTKKTASTSLPPQTKPSAGSASQQSTSFTSTASARRSPSSTPCSPSSSSAQQAKSSTLA